MFMAGVTVMHFIFLWYPILNLHLEPESCPSASKNQKVSIPYGGKNLLLLNTMSECPYFLIIRKNDEEKLF